MRFRTETLLNLLIVVVLAVDAFIALQIYQQRMSEPEPIVALSRPATSTTASPETEEPAAVTAGGGTVKNAIATTNAVNAKAAMQSAVLRSELVFVEDGAMPANAFALEAAVPGAKFVDGVGRADVGIIGVDRTDTTLLLVTAVTEGEWLCAAVDGQRRQTTYNRGQTRDTVAALANCTGTQDTWS